MALLRNRGLVFMNLVNAGSNTCMQLTLEQAEVSKISANANKCTPVQTISIVTRRQCIAKSRLPISPS